MTTTHRMHGTPTHTSWRKMRERCNNPKAAQYPWYGAKGVTVCKEWDTSFEAFVADMGERTPGATIDRIDSDKGYEPSNCRWADHLTQARNQKKTVMHGDITLREACERAGVSFDAAYQRLKRGVSPDQILSPEHRREKKSPEALAEYVRLRKEGLSHKQIGIRLGMSVGGLEKWSITVRKAGLL